ncbi:threonylcarbamoyl-AMP synthase [Rhodosalinus halophilus]|uniref:Threonylcarbamoyl-AMP synthase n=1 Tax=Rhodosalinus halophilus TaxID=2259333 RepID=A0A365U9K7_9RHOB|nr:L-threonylcarbamoyladenylate synthase [Rhodosalinus halophilus]RBI85722.1 threonylcarbamoyl-AMP synthase [Rhodosalinus halophilus]
MPDRPERLAPDHAGIARAVALLRAGDLVAIPTETVYGLAADARNDAAVAAIFAAKGRPDFNPLIAHVADAAAARELVRWSDRAEALAQAFWPGPLTLVLPLREGHGLSPRVTAGLDTLGVRVPDRAATLALLRAFGGPVAAPSANPSGQLSPTTPAHVVAGLGPRVAAVLDAGPCPVGVESTILALDPAPRLLRPGGVPGEAIEAVLGQAVAEPAQNPERPDSPGQLASHYAPRAALRLDATDWRPGERRLGFGPVDCDLNLSAAGDLAEAAANLFHHLHALDDGEAVIAVSPIPETGLGVAINDRLRRAAAPRG